jgi:hypothetical protein
MPLYKKDCQNGNQKGSCIQISQKRRAANGVKKGKEAVDRWKKERYGKLLYMFSIVNNTYILCLDTQISSYHFVQQPIEKQVFGMQLKEAVALTKIDDDDLVSGILKNA